MAALRYLFIAGWLFTYLDASAQAWERGPDMPTPRFNLGAVSVDGRLYAVGGTRHNTTNNTVNYSELEAFDPATGAWTTLAPMPTARFSFALAVAAGKIHAIGGHKGQVAYSAVESYDPKTDRWTLGRDMPRPRVAAAAASVDGIVYVIGGNIAGSGEVAAVDAYDPVRDSWTRRADMPTKRSGHVAVALDGKIYVLGGRGRGDEYKQGFATTLEVYDPVGDRWEVRAPMPTLRFQFAAESWGGKLYAISGRAQSGIVPRVEIYDPQTDRWESGVDLPTPRAGHAAASVGNRLYVIGGRTCIPECTVGSLELLSDPPRAVGGTMPAQRPRGDRGQPAAPRLADALLRPGSRP